MKILIAYDGSQAADTALQEVKRRPWPAGTQVHLVSVVDWPASLELPFPGGPEPGIEAARGAMVAKAKEALGEATSALSTRSDLDLSSQVRVGSPKHTLLDAIESWKPDLVVAGSSGKSGMQRLLVGSVCHALVTHAPCSVEVVKAPHR